MEQENETAASCAAAGWRARLQSPGVTAADRARFRHWLADPCHASAWQRLLRVERLAASALRADPRFMLLRERALSRRAGGNRGILVRLQRPAFALVVLLGLAALLAAVRPALPAIDPAPDRQVACTREDAPARGSAAEPVAPASPGPAEPGLEASLYAG